MLNPIRIFEGSFGGPTLYQNPQYVSPNEVNFNITTFDIYEFLWCAWKIFAEFSLKLFVYFENQF